MNQTNQTANQLLSSTVPDCTWNPPSNPSSTAPAHPRFPQLVREWDLFFENVIIFNIRNHIPGRLFPIFQTEALPLRVEGNAKTRLYTNVLMPINALLGTQGAIFDETIPGFLGIPDYVLCTNAGNNNPAVAKMSVEIKTRHNLNLGRYDLWDICRYADRAQISDTTFKFKKRILSQAFSEMACNGLHYGILTNYSDTYFLKRPETEPTTLYASHVVHPYHVAPTLRECVYYISHFSINDNVGNRLDRVMEDNVSSYDDDDGDDNDDDDGDDNDDDFSDNGFDDDYVPDNGDSSDNDDGSKKRKSSSSGKKKVVASSSKGITTIDNYIGGGTFGKVFSGKYHDQVVAWKTCDAYKEQEAMKMLKHEAHIYSILKEIQGNSIPCLLYEGYIYDGYLYTLALHLIEDARHIDPAILTIEEKESIVKQLESIHSFGVLHNDIAPRNILFEPKSHKYFFVDFGLSEIVGNESPKLRKEERRLKKFLQL